MGLITAKARACFSMADMTNLRKLQQKKSSVLCMGIWIFLFIVVKFLAEQNYI